MKTKNEKMENEKNEKPFYKKKWFIAVAVIAVIIIILNLPGEKVKWSSLSLGEYLPEPTKGTVDVGSDLEDYLSLSIDNVKSSYYEKYVEECIAKGYTIESKKTSTRYEAYNKEGYELSLHYSSNDISITLKAPEKMTEINWPTTGIGAILPVPKSNLGNVNSDSSNSYRVHVSNTTLADFKDYVSACQAKGFTVDYSNQEEYYYAKNADGYSLSVRYLGFNIIDILIQAPSESSSNNNSSSNSIRKDFKDAMDSYEKFIDEYVEFMKKYKNSNGTDLSLINDYTKYLEKYAEMVDSFDKWESEDMNTDEAAYYLEVQLRVNKKILEVAT